MHYVDGYVLSVLCAERDRINSKVKQYGLKP